MEKHPATPAPGAKKRRAFALRGVGECAALLAIGLLVWWFAPRFWNQPRGVTIGVEGQRLVTIEGPPLEAIPFTHGDPLAVRVASAQPAPDGVRYDLRYMAFRPGKHDLRDYLVAANKQRPANVPSMAFDIPSVLPANHAGELVDTPNAAIDLHSNYAWIMGGLWLLWGVALLPLVFIGRKHRVKKAPLPRQLSATDRLRHLLEDATYHELSPERQADLEKLLLLHWAKRLNLAQEPLATALDRMREHPAAGRQIRGLEAWLHGRSTRAKQHAASELLKDLASDLAAETSPTTGRVSR